MAGNRWDTGIKIIGDLVAWGTHFCVFYETKEDLLDTLIAYYKLGLERGEYCLWIVAEPFTIEEATDALKDAVPDLDRYLADSSLEFTSVRDWFLQGGTFDRRRVPGQFHKKLARALARGYPGMRVAADKPWLPKKEWRHFCDFEDGFNNDVIGGNQPLAALCSYPLATCGALEILDVVRTHQFALARRGRSWDVVETAGLKKAKAEIQRLNEELEQRVEQRTLELVRASDALREAQSELAHVNRVTTMGQLAASISHEFLQPIGAGMTNAQAALRFLDSQPPDLEEVREALGFVVSDINRAIDIINGIRALFKKAPLGNDALDINEVIRDVITLTHGEAVKNGVSVQTQLSNEVPLIQGDRVQLQQVILNLIINAVEAMRDVGEGSRELLISSGKDASGGVLVLVQDSGPGLPADGLDRLFDAFYTTKSSGMGMGLSICRSIVEQHGGRIWASREPGPGATIRFTLPMESSAKEPSKHAASSGG